MAIGVAQARWVRCSFDQMERRLKRVDFKICKAPGTFDAIVHHTRMPSMAHPSDTISSLTRPSPRPPSAPPPPSCTPPFVSSGPSTAAPASPTPPKQD